MKSERQAAEIRRRVAVGLLPRVTRSRTYGGPSPGRTCDACGLEIRRNAVEFDVDLLDGSGSVSETLTVHALCHEIWLQVSRDGPTLAGTPQEEAPSGDSPFSAGRR